MASRTQLRLSQVTGSFGTGAINDQIDAAATGSIATTDLQGVLSHLAGAIKRIHGEDSFSQNAAGEFAVTLQPSTDDGAALGGASNNWSDLYLADGAVINLGDDQDVTLTHIADIGVRLNGGSELQFRDTDLVISSSADGTLDIEADTQINIGTDRSGIAISLGHTTSEVTVNDNLTVTGDLTVNGATTTLDTTNLLVEDVVIGMAANAASQNQNGGLVIFSGSSDSDLVFGRIANDVWGLGKKATLKGTVTTLADMTLVNARAARYEVDGANDYLDVVSSDLTAVAAANFKVDAATDIILDADGADIFFEDGGTRFGGVSMLGGNNMLALSSSAGNNIGILSQGGTIYLGNKDASNAGSFNLGTDSLVKILDSTDRERIHFDAREADGFTMISGSFILDNGADPAELILSGTNGDTVTLDVPASPTTYTLTLPASNGTSGQVLKLSDNDGNLEFGDALGDLSKGVKIIAAQVSAGTAVNFNAVDAGDTISGLSTAGSQGKSLDVFVNGQLLVSGSEAERAAGDRDYAISSGTELKFAFSLEIDDVVQLVKR